ncbi:hypothetical protein Taro_036365, partial [Colocasia esculenta]|nr:hypothetical protein [Colocasia esculenta]
RRTQTENPIKTPSVSTRHSHPPSHVGVNDTPIGSLFQILDPQVACSDPFHLGFFKISGLSAKPKPGIRLGFHQFPHVTLTTRSCGSERHADRIPISDFGPQVACFDPFHLGFFKISGLSAEPKSGIRLGFRQFPYVTLTHLVMLE